MIVSNDYSENVINSMRYGIVPTHKIHYLTVGRDDIISEFRKNFEDTRAGKGKSLMIEGQFGMGKSHILNYAKYLANKNNCVVSEVTIDQTLLFNKMDKALNVILESIELPDIKSMKGFENIILEISRSNKKLLLEEWCNDTAGSGYSEMKLKYGIKAYLNAIKHSNSVEMADDIIRWIMCEKVEIKRIKEILKWNLGSTYNLSTLKFIQDEILDIIRAISQLFRDLGYSGWLILIDECENFFTLSNGPKTRGKIFNNINNLINGIKNIFIVFSVTPGHLDLIHDYFKSLQEKDKTPIPEFLYSNKRRIYLRQLKQLCAEDYKKLSKNIIKFYKKAYDEDNLNEQHENFLERFFILAEKEGLPTRSVIKTIIEVLDYCSCFPNETRHLLTSDFKLSADKEAREDSIKLGELLKHETIGVCKVVEIETANDGKIIIHVEALKDAQRKKFVQQYAKFKKIEMVSE